MGEKTGSRRAALVTGGSSGIGFAIAKMLREESFDVTIAARNGSALEAAAREIGATASTGDVAEEADCKRIVDAHRARFGRLDVLVNAAGIGAGGNVESFPTEAWDRVFAVNVRGVFLMTRAAIPHLKTQGGVIVNLSSFAGTIAASGFAAYGASKAAIVSFTRSLDAELCQAGVRAMALCPGFVDTPMATHSPLPQDQRISPRDCAEVVRMFVRLGPNARVPQLILESMPEPAARPASALDWLIGVFGPRR